ncbi:acyltransferase family protein [Stutzerimonas stutzeri]|uniref:acyltransferase family protein n=1 Tax=Stutzerimonas stutzeri TaxID=316 RepID=UPI0034D77E73
MTKPVNPIAVTHLPAADGIRGLACLIVLIMHGLSLGWPEQLFPLLKGGGKYGVWLFFVLSAFLLTLRLSNRGFSGGSLADYALGRTLRIMPLFVFACVLYAWSDVGIQNIEQLRSVLLLQSGSIHLWTVPVEYKAYFVLPLLVWAGVRLQRRLGNGALALAALAAVLAQQAAWPYWNTPADSPNTRWYLAPFIFGTFCALMLPWLSKRRRGTLGTIFALFTFIILVLALPGPRQALLGGELANDLMDKHVFIGLWWAVFIALLIDGHGLVGRMLSHRLLAYLGTISYSTYLFHWLIMVKVFALFPNNPLAFAAAQIMAIGAGSLGYHLAEVPLEHLRRRITPINQRSRFSATR